MSLIRGSIRSKVLIDLTKGNFIMANIFGNNAGNLLGIASPNVDNIFGFGGNDILNGFAGNDYLSGGTENDILRGGGGQDVLEGGSGFDLFDFDSVTESPVGAARDIIVDFVGNGVNAGDKIDLSRIDADVIANGNQVFDPAQLSYSAGGIFTANVIGTAADLQIELVGVPTLDIVGATNDIIF